LRRHPLGPVELQRVQPEPLTTGRPLGGPLVTSSRNAELSRRAFLRFSAAGAALTSTSGWLDVLAAHAAGSPAKHKSCILLWMDGGPSQMDTFDLKPGTRDAGEFKPIATSVPGIQVSEHFPKFARQMQHAAILRGMSTPEGGHARARYYMHTGYREGVGGLTYPSLGAITSAELGDPGFPLPNFVSVGGKGSHGAGFLGARHQPLVVTDPDRGVANLAPLGGMEQFGKRAGLLEDLDAGFARTKKAAVVSDRQTAYRRAVALMRSKEAKAFDLSREPAPSRAAYGGTKFGDGCLLARRLVEVGVP